MSKLIKTKRHFCKYGRQWPSNNASQQPLFTAPICGKPQRKLLLWLFNDWLQLNGYNCGVLARLATCLHGYHRVKWALGHSSRGTTLWKIPGYGQNKNHLLGQLNKCHICIASNVVDCARAYYRQINDGFWLWLDDCCDFSFPVRDSPSVETRNTWNICQFGRNLWPHYIEFYLRTSSTCYNWHRRNWSENELLETGTLQSWHISLYKPFDLVFLCQTRFYLLLHR